MSDTLTQPAKLLVRLHSKGSRHIELIHETFTIGRKANNSLVIEDAAMSGQHARIVKVQAVYFLEDLQSTNGTSVNNRPITRHQLRDADVITIGQHRLVFQDSGMANTALSAPTADLDHTMVLKGRDHAPEGPELAGRVLIVAGKTDRLEYQLSKQVTVIGSREGAVIRLTGWFAPKTAATIARRGAHYCITASQGAKSPLVNGTAVEGQWDLKDGDQIEVAGVKMMFYVPTRDKRVSQ